MFAEVYPLTRLPRRFGVFDYQCDDTVRAGDLVVIPFKGRELLGIVRCTKQKAGTDKRLSRIVRVKQRDVCTQEDIARLKTIATLIVQSPSTLLYQTFLGIAKKPIEPPPQIHKTARVNEALVQIIQSSRKEQVTFTQGSLETFIVLAYQYAKHLNGQLLIIAPHERDVETIAAYLPEDKRIARLHGHTPAGVRASIIHGWRTGKIDILVGTKQASLLPADSLSIGLLYYPTHQDHIQYDRNPRFDAADALARICLQHNADMHSCGPIPRIGKETPSALFLPNTLRVVDLNAQDQKTSTPFLSHDLQEAIATSLSENKRAIVLYNKKGYAKRLLCKDCGHVPFCGTCGSVPKVQETDLVCPVCHTEMWIPKQCPSCGGDNLRPRGIGNERLLEAWQRAFPNATIAIVDKAHNNERPADILLVTEYFFESIHTAFHKWNVGVVADACADLHMSHSADAGLQAATRAHRLALFATGQQARAIIQTWTPTLVTPIMNPSSFIKQECVTRKTYQLPPFSYRITIRVRGKKNASVHELHDLQAFVEHQDDMQWFPVNESAEILTKPEKYGILLPHLQKLPDNCIIQVSYA